MKTAKKYYEDQEDCKIRSTSEEDGIYLTLGYALELMDGYASQQPSTECHNLDERQIKDIATKFFYWWWNSKGNNTDQGFDQWWSVNKTHWIKNK